MDIIVNDLKSMDRTALLELWFKIFTGTPPRKISMPFIRRILAFEIQARLEGGVSTSTSTKLNRLLSVNVRTKSPRLKTGARLLREWNGVTHVVEITENGFLWHDEQHRSLSAVARAITGAHWSGPRFFGLKQGEQK